MTRRSKRLEVVKRLQGVRKGLQGVTEGYKNNRWLQGVTGVYRVFQRVTEGDKRLRGVTRGYRG